jgi:hypothetical protein
MRETWAVIRPRFGTFATSLLPGAGKRTGGAVSPPARALVPALVPRRDDDQPAAIPSAKKLAYKVLLYVRSGPGSGDSYSKEPAVPTEPQSPDPGQLELDTGRLFEDLDRKRRQAHLSRTTVCQAMGVSPAAWTRLNWAGTPSARTLVQVVAWLDADLRNYLTAPRPRKEVPVA